MSQPIETVSFLILRHLYRRASGSTAHADELVDVADEIDFFPDSSRRALNWLSERGLVEVVGTWSVRMTTAGKSAIEFATANPGSAGTHFGPADSQTCQTDLEKARAPRKPKRKPRNMVDEASAQELLVQFGITRASAAYDRALKPSGFRLDDLADLICSESLTVFLIDWRAEVLDELQNIRKALLKFGVRLEVEANGLASTVVVRSGERQARADYESGTIGVFDPIIEALAEVVDDALEFRHGCDNGGSDTSMYAVLPRSHWKRAEEISRKFIDRLFD